MGFSIFFESVDPILTESLREGETLGGQLWVNKDGIENWKEADVAIFGINEFRGNGGFNSSNDDLVEFRRSLYNLSPLGNGLRVYDLGNIKPGQDLEGTYKRVEEVSNLLIENDIIPICIGGSHDLDIGLIAGLANHKKESRIGIVDDKIDLYPQGSGTVATQSHLSRIFMDEQSSVSGFSILGYQSYLAGPSVVSLMQKLCFEHFRLGSLRDRFENLEPVIRDLDLLSIDLSCIKMQDFPASTVNNPFGFTGDEFVRLCWYAGNNDLRKGIGFFGYDSNRDVSNISAKILAVGIWYFLEGVNSGKKKHHPAFDMENFINYKVNLNDKGGDLQFFKSKMMEKWWIELPDLEGREGERKFISCLYEDYQDALKGELPNRWVQAQSWS